MIVIDVGCQEHYNEESTHTLIRRFDPKLYFGFDPVLDVPDGVEQILYTVCVRRRAAAWLHGGQVDFYLHGIDGGVETSAQSQAWPCIDLLSLIETLPQPLIVKMDCEGSEFPLMQEIHNRQLDEKIDLMLVEFHFQQNSHGHFVPEDQRPQMRCPVEPW